MPSSETTSVEDFYPRPPRGGRHDAEVLLFIMQDISIHALREEGDSTSRRRKPERRHFYPRPPRGGRRGLGLVEEQLRGISIHALREEGDQKRRSRAPPW